MADIQTWSTTAASNNSAAPDGFPEGMAPSGVNDAAREVMAAVKTFILDAFDDYITGLGISNGTDSDHDIDVATGAAMDTTGVEVMRLTSGITKQIDAAWSVGTNQGGLDTGSVAAETLYAVWLIQRSDTYVVDVLFSTSFTVAGITKPTNYDRFQRIGAVMTDDTVPANIVGFTQSGDTVNYHSVITAFTSYNPSASVTLETKTIAGVPPSAEIEGVISCALSTSVNLIDIFVQPTASTAIPAGVLARGRVDLTTLDLDDLTVSYRCIADGSSQVKVAVREQTGTATVQGGVYGYRDLGRGAAS